MPGTRAETRGPAGWCRVSLKGQEQREEITCGGPERKGKIDLSPKLEEAGEGMGASDGQKSVGESPPLPVR